MRWREKRREIGVREHDEMDGRGDLQWMMRFVSDSEERDSEVWSSKMVRFEGRGYGEMQKRFTSSNSTPIFLQHLHISPSSHLFLPQHLASFLQPHPFA
ncbi:hypothetical protein Pcinc_039254 [Petrolisthes cinctipes]|uniref:Uncharacterized protein n=1 Tax=Petrolisthes cinctipes TaxID=88211 RepID=A0AAE1EJF7_PETCI|nr:hypothetical protein Pcinc_039254 [Petrolisthes cinctipes]